MRYYTDGTHLYEIASQRAVQNYGRLGGIIRYTILRDCVSETVAPVDELTLTALSEVGGPMDESRSLAAQATSASWDSATRLGSQPKLAARPMVGRHQPTMAPRRTTRSANPTLHSRPNPNPGPEKGRGRPLTSHRHFNRIMALLVITAFIVELIATGNVIP